MDNKPWFNYRRLYGMGHHHYEPFYDQHADYNTNAKSYYDYLGRFNAHIRIMTEFINRLADRNIEVIDSNSIDLTKIGDWIDNGGCAPENFDDIIKFKADVIISKQSFPLELVNIKKSYSIKNGSKILTDGLWSPDYESALKGIDSELGSINNKIDDLYNKIETINNKIIEVEKKVDTNTTNIANNKNALQKIIDNLYNSGAITNSNINTFNFRPSRNIATGNINFFSGVVDGNSFIKTSDSKTENDVTSGY